MSVVTKPVPFVASAEEAAVDDLGYRDDAITHVTVPIGYLQRADVPAVLAALPRASLEAPIDLDDASYFLSTIDLTLDPAGPSGDDAAPMAGWRRRLFVATSALTADAADYFNLPRDRTVIIGSRISL